jgi:hypothetical protein
LTIESFYLIEGNLSEGKQFTISRGNRINKVFPSHGGKRVNRKAQFSISWRKYNQQIRRLMERKESTDIQNLSISWRENNQQLIFRIFPTHRRKIFNRIFPFYGGKIINRYAKSFQLMVGK